MQRTIGYGLKQIRNWENYITIVQILINWQKYWNNFIKVVRYVYITYNRIYIIYAQII